MGLFKRQNYKPAKFDGTFVFTDFSYGLYNLDTPRSIPEQISSLALTGGRNVWTEKGALVNQYGYNINGVINEEDIVETVISDDAFSSNIFIICQNKSVYYYDNISGLKKYKTKLATITDLVGAANGKVLYLVNGDDRYIFGGTYNADSDVDVTFTPILSNVTIYPIGDGFSTYITAEDLQYFWLDKGLVVYDSDNDKYVEIVVNSITPYTLDDSYDYVVNFRYEDPSEAPSSATTSIGEKTLHELSATEFKWIPEQDSLSDITERVLQPKLMAVALNRLWVVDFDNTIFYSAVGNMASFDQANGAGYFKGFYQDTSEVLSIEEYFSGVLITKQTGMYHARLTTREYSFTSGSGTIIANSTSENYIDITKVNNIPQKFAGDHIIIGDEVIAYDSSGGNLVQAAYVNYLNNIQQGPILLHGSELDVQSLGIYSSNNRILCYSAKEEALILYYGENLNRGLVITRGLSLFPREVKENFFDIKSIFQTIVGVTKDGNIIDDFARGTVINDVSSVAEFEQVGIRSNKMLCGTILEFTEINGIDFNVSTANAGLSEQHLTAYISRVDEDEILPPLIYSDLNRNFRPDSYAEETRWAKKKSFVTRLAAPLGGRDGLGITLEFPSNVAFCLVSIGLPDLSQGE